MPSVYGDAEIVNMAKGYVRARRRVEQQVFKIKDPDHMDRVMY